MLEEQCLALLEFGFTCAQLLPVALHQHHDPALVELHTHCDVLAQARRETWRNVFFPGRIGQFCQKVKLGLPGECPAELTSTSGLGCTDVGREIR